MVGWLGGVVVEAVVPDVGKDENGFVCCVIAEDFVDVGSDGGRLWTEDCVIVGCVESWSLLDDEDVVVVDTGVDVGNSWE